MAKDVVIKFKDKGRAYIGKLGWSDGPETGFKKDMYYLDGVIGISFYKTHVEFLQHGLQKIRGAEL